MFVALGMGRFPESRHDGTEWDDSDPLGDQQAMARKCVLLWIEGGWSEHSKTLGLSSWASRYTPCQYCCLVKDELHSMSERMACDPDTPTFPLRQHDAYE
eukprot:2952665-Pyramimonas_sp.AAC.1